MHGVVVLWCGVHVCVVPWIWVVEPDRRIQSTSFSGPMIDRQINRTTCFSTFTVPGPAPVPIPAQYMTLRPGCTAVDAGAVLPNINEGFLGAAPDLGAFELGQPLPAYGPRPSSQPPPTAPTNVRAVF